MGNSPRVVGKTTPEGVDYSLTLPIIAYFILEINRFFSLIKRKYVKKLLNFPFICYNISIKRKG